MKRVLLVLGALVAAIWYFILRVGPRRELPEGSTPVTAEGAIDHARRVAAVDQVRPPGPGRNVGTDDRHGRRGARGGQHLLSADARGHRDGERLDPRHAVRLPARRRRRPVRGGVRVQGARRRQGAAHSRRAWQPRLHELEADARRPGRRGRRGHAARPDPPGSSRSDRPAAGDAARLAGRARRAPEARPRRRPRGLHRRRGNRGPLRQRQVPRRLHPRHRADHAPAPGPLRDDLPLSRRHDRGRRPVAHRTTPPPSSRAATTSRFT